MYKLLDILRFISASVQLCGIVIALIGQWAVWSLNFWVPKRRDLPKFLNDDDYGQHCFYTYRGQRLHYVSNNNCGKSLMLFVHGFPGFWYSWRHQIKKFSRDFWTVAVDLKGFGLSDKPLTVSQYDSEVIIDELRSLIEFLGEDRCILVCHGDGGHFGWLFVEAHPCLVQCYVAIGSPHYESMTMWDTFSTSYMEVLRIPNIGEMYLGINDYGFISSMKNDNPSRVRSGIKMTDLGIYKAVMGQPDTLQCYMNYYRANPALYRGEVLRQTKAIEVPVLAICGEKDPRLGKVQDSTHYVVDFVCHTIENANHYVHENDYLRVNCLIENYLQENKLYEIQTEVLPSS